MVGASTSRSARLAPRRFVWVLLLFAAYPLALIAASPGGVRYAAMDVVAIALYLASWPGRRRVRAVASVVSAVGCVLLLVAAWNTTGDGSLAGSRPWLYARTVLLLLFFWAITWTTLRAVLGRSRVTLDTVLGAVCVYLLLGALWGVLYDLASLHNADAFLVTSNVAAGATRRTSPGGLTLPDSIYFSYSTLTTVGFGDIIPTTTETRTLSWLEAATGQMYLVVLVARLVSLHIAHSSEGDVGA
jgi:hypothetical protein